MATTPVGTVATGDTITANTQNTMRDNVSVLDVRTGGDPGVVDLLLISNGATSGHWALAGTNSYGDGTITAAKLAAGVAASNLGHAPGTGIGNLAFYDAGNKVVAALAADAAVNASNLGAIPAAKYVRLDGGQDFDGSTPPTIGTNTIVTTGNIGSFQAGAAANALNLGAIPAASYARFAALANFTAGLQSGGSGVVTAASIGSLTAGSATLAIDSSNLGAIPAASYARFAALANFTAGLQSGGSAVITAANIGSQTVAAAGTAGSATTAASATDSANLGGVAAAVYAYQHSGTFSGSGTTNAITGVGFRPKKIDIMDDNGALYAVILNGIVISMPSGGAIGASTVTIGSDGWTFGANTGAGANVSGHAYHYVAFG